MGSRSDVGEAVNSAVVLDIFLVLSIVATFYFGSKRGLIVGILGLIGYVGGAIGAMALAPGLLHSINGPLKRALITAILVFVFASVGQSITTHVGFRARKALLWRPLRLIDSALGGIAAVLAVILLFWVFATLGNLVGSTSISSALNRSALVAHLDKYIPHALTTWVKSEAVRLMG